MNNYTYTKANHSNDLEQLVELFNNVFAPEKVGQFARILSDFFPGFSFSNWYVAKEQNKIVSAFASIPWQWNFDDIHLKVAELGILGTCEEHRNKGLFKHNNQLFEHDLQKQEYDLAVIQGIPGIYHRLGYYYALPMENHTEVPLHSIPSDLSIDIREAQTDDIPFLIEEETYFKKNYNITSNRSPEQWQYILKEGRKSEYGSRIFIIKTANNQYYFRILDGGFGTGLTISEASMAMPADVQTTAFSFLKQEAQKLKKPYLRLNLPDSHPLVKAAHHFGATVRPSYAWQIKIVDNIRFINKIKPILEKRIKSSAYFDLTGFTALNCYQFQVNIEWKNGLITDINQDHTEEASYTLSIPEHLLTNLLLGYRSWRELQYISPDVFPADQYLRFSTEQPSEACGSLFEVLFPKLNNWINLEY